ncbi:MAG: hypothetical protein LPK07_12590 [Hymenobacteraceae bacterium]|nr:hypothetical protein [Hymenobacteraceae bacterium]
MGFTREFTDRISQEMLDEERIELQHRREEEERRRMNEYPYCNLDERPANYRRPLEDTPPEIL